MYICELNVIDYSMEVISAKDLRYEAPDCVELNLEQEAILCDSGNLDYYDAYDPWA